MARHVIVTKHFDRYAKDFNDGVLAGLKDVGRDIENGVHSQSPVKGYRIQEILGATTVEVKQRTQRGHEVRVGYTDFRGLFFEKGTYKGRRSKLKRGRRSTSGQAGVRAGHYLRKALKNAEGDAIGKIARHLP